VPQVLASILRNTNSYGLNQPPRLGADEVSRLPVSQLLDTDAYPSDPVTIVDAAAEPVTCVHWAKAADAEQSSLSLLAGAALPIPEGMRPLDLVGAGNGVTADRVALAPGSGYFVQTVGQEPGSPIAGSLFWVSDTGVRYGIEPGGDDQTADQTVAALGLTAPPVPVPWSVLAQFAAGPTLSRDDALLAHDALTPDPNPARLANPTSQENP
jgi:type VII secretion protein EccB